MDKPEMKEATIWFISHPSIYYDFFAGSLIQLLIHHD